MSDIISIQQANFNVGQELTLQMTSTSLRNPDLEVLQFSDYQYNLFNLYNADDENNSFNDLFAVNYYYNFIIINNGYFDGVAYSRVFCGYHNKYFYLLQGNSL